MVNKSISNVHFAVFLSRQCQNVENVHETFINTKLHRAICRVRVRNVPQVSPETSLPWLVQNNPSENKVEFLERQFHAKSFRLSTKRTLSILLNFLFPFVFFIGVLSILKCKTLVLKTTTSWTRASHFVDGWHFQRCQISFFPHSPPSKWLTWPLDVFERVAGMGDFTDLVCIGRIFSQTSLKLEIFSLTYNGVRFFFSIIRHERYIFFSAGYFSPRNLFACFFPLEISLQDIFSEITHNPLKSQMVGP